MMTSDYIRYDFYFYRLIAMKARDLFFCFGLVFCFSFTIISLPSFALKTAESSANHNDPSAKKMSPLVIKIFDAPPSEKPNEQPPQINYYKALLKLVLDKTVDSHGPYLIETKVSTLDTNECFSDLRRGGNVNLLWSMISAPLDRDFRAIKISLLKGLGEHRIFLIRKDHQEKFDKIKSLDDLKKMTAGLGVNWPDTKIMKANGLPVVTHDVRNLHSMLAGKRFDYFSRGVYEVWDELTANEKLGLAIEKNLMLYYEAPTYYFVNKKDEAIARRIEEGLRLITEDGSWNELFFSIPSFKRGYDEINNSNRVLIKLEATEGR
jgi:hypothetical protein